jgi:hypothetical protein
MNLFAVLLVQTFGSVQTAMMSLYLSTTGGENWVIYYNMLWPTGFNSCSPILSVMLETRRKDMADARQLMELLRTSDLDHDGLISLKEFTECMRDPEFRSYFTTRSLDIKDAEMFYRMLSTVAGREEVDIRTFVATCLT